MLYREIVAVCSQIHTKHINTAVWTERRFAEFDKGDTYSDHWALEGKSSRSPSPEHRLHQWRDGVWE
jgi:hypothetical protein